jgi:Insertion element 4 transposase N-terminal/Transposase DDE domain
MELGRALLATSFEPEATFDVFSRELDLDWIRRALEVTGTATIRRRKLPAEHVVWMVVGMGLLRDRPIQDVVRHLNLVLPDAEQPGGRGRVSGGAIVQARDRLGAEPLAVLFADTADNWATRSADQYRWRGLAVYGVDGSTLRVPDTEENEAAFGRPHSGRGGAGYPQARVVAIMVLRSHLLGRVEFGPSSDSEVKLAERIWPTLPDHSITIVDRGFISYRVFHAIQTGGQQRHWLTRAKVKSLGRGDHLVEIPINRNLRRAHPHLPETLTARAIRYRRRGFRPQRLLTSLLDAKTYPAHEIVALYHERWEMEVVFDEIKTHTLEREETLRSRTPERIRQELWGLALAYNLVRLEMEHAAQRIGLPPNRISYRSTLLLVRTFWLATWQVGTGNVPRRLEILHEDVGLHVLPPRRERRYPRAVKIKMSNYPLKRDGLK